MTHEDPRKKKLELLKQTLANKDFVQARRLLENHDTEKPRDKDVVTPPRGAGVLPARPAFASPTAGRGVELTPSADQPHGTYRADESAASRDFIRIPLVEAAPRRLAVAREFAAVLRGARQRVDELAASPALCHAQNAKPEDLLFVTAADIVLHNDTEAYNTDADAAAAESTVFLVSVMRFENEQLVFEHFLARRPEEESAVLNAFARRLEETGLLVAFDNKTLNLTHFRRRADERGVDFGDRLPPRLNIHDESRRRWKGKLPSFTLKTLEKQICRRLRRDDVPADSPLDNALHHHRLDLLAQAEILTAILTQCDPPDLDYRPRRKRSDSDEGNI